MTNHVVGFYQLRIHLREPREIEIGRLGRFFFPAGFYVYTGSAKSGVEARVARHLRADKKLHWHIDYLLQYAKVVGVETFGDETSECELALAAMKNPGAKVIAKGFGASDCRCESHLAYIGDEQQQ